MLDSFISTVLVHYTEKGKCEQTLEKVSDAVTCLCSSSWKIIEVESFKIRLSLLARLCESFFPCFCLLLGSASLVFAVRL